MVVNREIDVIQQRTLKQNSALHLLLDQLSKELNDNDKTMTRVLKHDAEIFWNKDLAKEYLFRPFLKALHPDKTSSTELTTKELSEVSEQMLNHVAKVTGIALDFPSIQTLMQDKQASNIRR